MSYTPRTRDRYRLAVVSLTSLTTVGFLGATGVTAGLAARQYSDQKAAQEADNASQQAAAQVTAARARAAYRAKLARYRARTAKPVVRHHPVVTRTITRYVTAAPSTGGTVSSGSYSGSSGSSSGSAPAAAGVVERVVSAVLDTVLDTAAPSVAADRTWTTFATLGTRAFLAVRDPRDLPDAEATARSLLDEVDRACSRFREDSDLAEVNRHPGSWVPVGPTLAAAVRMACDAARHTDGIVDPLLGRTLVTLGYDRDFALVDEDLPQEWAAGLPSETEATGTWRDIRVNDAQAIRIPAGTALDLGATGKAWAADLIASAWTSELRGAALVSLGGDLRIAAPDGEPWQVTIADRPGDAPATQVGLDSGGLATSSTQVRRWTRGGVRRHHLLDPRTRQPASEVWRTVTATGPTCAAANTATTAAIVLGAEAPAWLEQRGVDARLVAADGAVTTVGRWPSENRRETVA